MEIFSDPPTLGKKALHLVGNERQTRRNQDEKAWNTNTVFRKRRTNPSFEVGGEEIAVGCWLLVALINLQRS